MSVDNGGKHIFKVDYNISLEASEQKLQDSQLGIVIRDENNEIISTLSINLFDCATGPSHFDYSFPVIQQSPVFMICNIDM